jgi:hypothetical protein
VLEYGLLGSTNKTRWHNRRSVLVVAAVVIVAPVLAVAVLAAAAAVAVAAAVAAVAAGSGEPREPLSSIVSTSRGVTWATSSTGLGQAKAVVVQEGREEECTHQAQALALALALAQVEREVAQCTRTELMPEKTQMHQSGNMETSIKHIGGGGGCGGGGCAGGQITKSSPKHSKGPASARGSRTRTPQIRVL